MRVSGKYAVIIFIIGSMLLCIAGIFYFFFPRQQAYIASPLPDEVVTVTTGNSPTPQGAADDRVVLSTLIEQFFTAYSDCLSDPPQEAQGRVGAYCQSHNPYSTTSFYKNITTGGTVKKGVDPVFCSRNAPSSVTLESVDFEAPDRGIVMVTAVFGSSLAQKIPVTVMKEGAQWKVETIDCSGV